MHIASMDLVNWLAHRRLAVDCAPFTIVAGPNHTGKSSIADAVSFVLLSDLCRVDAKGERAELLSEGADKGSVTLRVGIRNDPEEPRAITRDVESGKLETREAIPVGDGVVTQALPFLLSPARIAKASADDRRALLLAVQRVPMDRAAMFNALVLRGHPMSVLDALPATTEPADWPAFATKKATEARGGWKATTGEAYGDKKAAGWKRQVEAPTEEEMTEATDKAAQARRAADSASEALGAAQTADRMAQTVANQLSSLRAEAASGKRAAERLVAARAALPGLEQEMEATKAEVAALEANLPGSGDTACPHCGGALHIGRDRTLTIGAAAQRRVTPEEVEAARDAARKAAGALVEGRSRISTAERDIAAGDRATKTLAALEEGGDANTLPLEEAQANATAARQAASTAEAELTALEVQMRDAARAAEVTKKAGALHLEVQAWIKLAEDTAPGGLPGEMLAKALGPLNDLLRDYAAATGWRQVAIGADMRITAGGRRYSLLSESEQWRVDAMLAAALAVCSGLRLVLLDRFDVLEVPARRPALGWLYSLTKGGALEQVILAGTMKEPPQVPKDVAMVWLGEAPAAEKEAA